MRQTPSESTVDAVAAAAIVFVVAAVAAASFQLALTLGGARTSAALDVMAKRWQTLILA